MKFDHALKTKHYTIGNALLWGNCKRHCELFLNGKSGYRIVHLIIAALEALPILGQIASLAERFLVLTFSEKVPNSLKGRVRKERDHQGSGSKGEGTADQGPSFSSDSNPKQPPSSTPSIASTSPSPLSVPVSSSTNSIPFSLPVSSSFASSSSAANGTKKYAGIHLDSIFDLLSKERFFADDAKELIGNEAVLSSRQSFKAFFRLPENQQTLVKLWLHALVCCGRTLGKHEKEFVLLYDEVEQIESNPSFVIELKADYANLVKYGNIYSLSFCHLLAQAENQALLYAGGSTQPLSHQDIANEFQKASRRLVNAIDEQGRTPLHCALMQSSSPILIQALLQASPEAAMVQDKEGKTVLHYAVEKENIDLVKMILAASPESARVQDREGKTALHRAIFTLNDAAVRELLQQIPDLVHCADDGGNTPLHTALQPKRGGDGLKEQMMLKEILRCDPNGYAQNRKGETPISLAAKFSCSIESLYVIGYCARQSASKTREALHVPDPKWNYGLSLAIESGDSDLVNNLLQLTPSLKTYDEDGFALIHRAVKFAPILKLLLGNDAALVSQTTLKPSIEKRSPLHLAVESGSIEAIQTLLDAGAEINSQDAQGNTPLVLAVQKRDFESVKLLVSKGANIELVNRNRASASTLADDLALTEMSIFLNSNKQILQSFTSAQHTPLQQAVLRGDMSTMQSLFTSGIDPNLRDQEGNTLLMLAAIGGHAPIVRELITTYKADVNLVNRAGWGALMLAGQRGHVEVVRLLLDEGKADIISVKALGTEMNRERQDWMYQVSLEILNLLLQWADAKPVPPLFATQTTIRQSELVGNCFLLASLDCLLATPEGKEMIRSMFDETNPRFIKVKISNLRNLDDPTTPEHVREELRKKYQYQYDQATGEAAFTLDRLRLSVIQTRKGGVESNSLAIKILESLSSYYLCENVPRGGGCTYIANVAQVQTDLLAVIPFLEKLLDTKIEAATLSIDSRQHCKTFSNLIQLRDVDPKLPIFISMEGTNPGEQGHVWSLESIDPLRNGLLLKNPWNTEAPAEFYSYDTLVKRKAVAGIFRVNNPTMRLQQAIIDENVSEIQRWLNREGVNIHLPDENNKTAVELAEETKNPGVIQLLTHHQEQLKQKLNEAIGANDVKRVIKLIEIGAVFDDQYLSLFREALKSNQSDIIRALINRPIFLRGRTPLMRAVINGDLAAVKFLRRLGALVDYSTDGWGWNLLHHAVFHGHVEIVKELLSANPSLVKTFLSGTPPWNALHIATGRENGELVELLLAHGADIDQKTGSGGSERTPLMIAAQQGNLSIVELLLNSGADPALQNRWGRSALDLSATEEIRNRLARIPIAASSSSSPIPTKPFRKEGEMRYLRLSLMGDDYQFRFRDTESPKMVQLLQQAYAKKVPLQQCLNQHQSELFKLLFSDTGSSLVSSRKEELSLEKGGREAPFSFILGIEESEFPSFSIYYDENGRKRVANLDRVFDLNRKPIYLEVCSHSDWTGGNSLTLPVKTSYLDETLKQMLHKFFNRFTHPNVTLHELGLSCRKIEQLIEQGASYQVLDGKIPESRLGQSLHKPLPDHIKLLQELRYREEFRLEAVRWHEQISSPISSSSGAGASLPSDPFEICLEYNFIDKLLELVDASDVSIRGSLINSLFVKAAQLGRREICQILQKRGAEIDAKDSEGKTALLRAAEAHHSELFEELLNWGADPKVKDLVGNTVVHLNVNHLTPSIVQRLVKAGVDIDAQNDEGKRPFELMNPVNLVLLKEFLAAGARLPKVEQINHKKWAFPLFLEAVEEENLPIILTLLQAGLVDLTEKNNQSQTPYTLASKKNKHSSISQLLKAFEERQCQLRYREFSSKAKQEERCSLLAFALDKGYLSVLEAQINQFIENPRSIHDHSIISDFEKACDKQIKKYIGSSYYFHIKPPKVGSTDYDLLKLVLIVGPRLKSKGCKELKEAYDQFIEKDNNRLLLLNNLFYTAITAKDHELVEAILAIPWFSSRSFKDNLNRGINHNDGFIPFELALQQKDKKLLLQFTVAKLLKENPDVQLHLYAAEHGFYEILSHLIDESKLNLKQLNEAFNLAIKKGESRFHILKKLLKAGAVPSQLDHPFLISLLLRAIEKGDREIVEAILSNNPLLINYRDHLNNTLLHLAAKEGFTEIVQLILSAPSEMITHKNDKSQTASDLAAEYGRLHLIPLLNPGMAAPSSSQPLVVESVGGINVKTEISMSRFGDSVLVQPSFAVTRHSSYSRPAQSVILMVDVSGSMNKVKEDGTLRKAIEHLAEKLPAGDSLTIIAFHTDATVVMSPFVKQAGYSSSASSSSDSTSSFHDLVDAAISSLVKMAGGTKIDSPFMKLSEESLITDQTRIVLLTDGVGGPPLEEFSKIYHQLHEHYGYLVPIDTVAMTIECKPEKLLNHLNMVTNGLPMFVKTQQEMEEELQKFTPYLVGDKSPDGSISLLDANGMEVDSKTFAQLVLGGDSCSQVFALPAQTASGRYTIRFSFADGTKYETSFEMEPGFSQIDPDVVARYLDVTQAELTDASKADSGDQLALIAQLLANANKMNCTSSYLEGMKQKISDYMTAIRQKNQAEVERLRAEATANSLTGQHTIICVRE